MASTRNSPIILWQYLTATVSAEDARGLGLGGWSLNVQHRYDPQSGTLYLGDGSQRSAKAAGQVITTVAGMGWPYSPSNPPPQPRDDVPATEEPIWPNGVAVGPDGSLYIADSSNVGRNVICIRRVWPNGRIARVADLSGPYTIGFQNPKGLAVGPDGSVYFSRITQHGMYPDSGHVFRLSPDGNVTEIAGIWTGGYSGDGGPATQAGINGGIPGIAASPDGSLYIADQRNQCIRRIGPDGIINTFAGFCTVRGFRGDGGPASQALLSDPSDVAIGPDGSLYIVDYSNQRIRRVGADGIITTVAGKGVNCGPPDGDDGPATQACLAKPVAVAVGTDGSFYIADSNQSPWGGASIRRVGLDGVISTVAGSNFPTGGYVYNGEGGPARQSPLTMTNGGPRIAVGPDGSVYVADIKMARVHRVASAYPGGGLGEYALPSEDGSELYYFDASGRHLQTLNALTGAARYRFGYLNGRLQSVTDGDNNVTTIEHPGYPTAIVAPFGQRTALQLDNNGYLYELTDPAGGSYEMKYTALGLMTRFQDPNGKASGKASSMDYDDQGLLKLDIDAAGGAQTLTRTRQY